MNPVVIIPTYNEADNLRELVRRIRLMSNATILVVDDSPGEDTSAMAAWLMCDVIHRQHKHGLSSAVINGLRRASKTTDKIIVMDADLQHPPELIPAMLEALDKHDFVVTDRTCGSFNMSPARRVISAVANLLSRPLLPKVKDPMTGFFGLRTSILPDSLGSLSEKGFKIMLELLVKLRVTDIAVVPLDFGKRLSGESKLKGKVIQEYLTQLISLYLWKWRLSRFLIVGAFGAVVNLFVLFAFTDWVGLHYLISYCIAFFCSVTNNYILNSLWTFSDRKWSVSGLGRYAVTTAIALPLGGGFLLLLVDLAGVWYILADCILIASASLINYVLSRRYVWNRAKQQA
jgi:dolichol-phosphate mannosyltransferase